MKQTRPLFAVLAGLGLAGTWFIAFGQSGTPPPSHNAFWLGFLVALPIGLGIIVWMERRWAPMACVIYGTVGLALDLSTIVQIVVKDPEGGAALTQSAISGILNFLLIVLGGRFFLDVNQGPMPPGSRPPSPPSPSSSAAT
jgi:uncharacterized protein involved in response to NO